MLIQRISNSHLLQYRTIFGTVLWSAIFLTNSLLAQSSPKLGLDKVYSIADERMIPRKAVDAARNYEREFNKYGEDGFSAACLLIETGHASTRIDRLIKESYFEGAEEKLLALCERDELPNFGMWSALRGLGVANTPAVRNYLLERLKNEQDPGFFMSAAQALGELEEPSGVEIVGKRLLEFRDRWGGVERHLMSAMFNMESEQSVPWLSRYLSNEKSKQLASAIYYINQLNPELAKRTTKELIENRDDIDPVQLSLIRSYAK